MSKKLAAVSGGPDSMALLHKYQKDIYAVCHVNYHKRATANRDEKIVKKFCKENNIRFFSKQVTQKDYEKYQSNNFQDVARKIRYDFFNKIALKNKIKSIYVAHNLDDYAETALMQFNRNSQALYFGIKKENLINGLLIIRPLINIRKKTLENYCLKNNIPFGIDESNLSDAYTRNKTRKIISNWSSKEFKNFIGIVNKFNKQNKSLLHQVNKSYLEWKNMDYSLQYFLSINELIQFHLIYLFLNSNNIISCSKEKIYSIISFLKATNNSKKYRIGNNKYIIKNKNNISILN